MFEPWQIAVLASVVAGLWWGIRNLDRWADKTDARVDDLEAQIARLEKRLNK